MSEVMEADFSDSLTFLVCFVLVFGEIVGSSWRLKADFGDFFTFLSHFAGLPGLSEAQTNLHHWTLTLKIGLKFAQQLLKLDSNNGPSFVFFFADFGVWFVSISGAILESKWGKKRQHGPKKVFKGLKVPKSGIFKKCDFTIVNPYFSSLVGAQEEHTRFKMALKRHLKGFKTRTKKSHALFSICWTNSGTDLGVQNGPRN